MEIVKKSLQSRKLEKCQKIKAGTSRRIMLGIELGVKPGGMLNKVCSLHKGIRLDRAKYKEKVVHGGLVRMIRKNT